MMSAGGKAVWRISGQSLVAAATGRLARPARLRVRRGEAESKQGASTRDWEGGVLIRLVVAGDWARRGSSRRLSHAAERL